MLKVRMFLEELGQADVRVGGGVLDVDVVVYWACWLVDGFEEAHSQVFDLVLKSWNFEVFVYIWVLYKP